MRFNSVYIIGSLRNERVQQVGNLLRSFGIEAFDDWFAAGPEADDYWQKYSNLRGHKYKEALAGYAAQHVFNFDKYHLDRCDAALLVLPAGKSGHLELGYCAGKGKPTYILLDGEPERFDVMYNFATEVLIGDEDIERVFNAPVEYDTPRPGTPISYEDFCRYFSGSAD